MPKGKKRNKKKQSKKIKNKNKNKNKRKRNKHKKNKKYTAPPANNSHKTNRKMKSKVSLEYAEFDYSSDDCSSVDKYYDMNNYNSDEWEETTAEEVKISCVLQKIQDDVCKHHHFWKLFPYTYRKKKSKYADGKCNIYYFYSINTNACTLSELSELLNNLTLKELKILIEENGPNQELNNLFSNAQFGDCVDFGDVENVFILGFGDLSMDIIHNAYQTNTEKDYLKLIKASYEYLDRACLHIPSEVSSADIGYYDNAVFTNFTFRFIDPLRMEYKGSMWEKVMLEVYKRKDESTYNDSIFPDDWMVDYIRCGNNKNQYKFIWYLKNEVSNTEMCARRTKEYFDRYDEAVKMRRNRIANYLSSLCDLGTDIMFELISFCVWDNQQLREKFYRNCVIQYENYVDF